MYQYVNLVIFKVIILLAKVYLLFYILHVNRKFSCPQQHHNIADQSFS